MNTISEMLFSTIDASFSEGYLDDHESRELKKAISDIWQLPEGRAILERSIMNEFELSEKEQNESKGKK